MKLIDIEDEMLLKNLFCGGLSAKKVTRLFMNQPQVEAIPINWIVNHKKYPTNKDKAKVIEDMIEDWRKENEID